MIDLYLCTLRRELEVMLHNTMREILGIVTSKQAEQDTLLPTIAIEITLGDKPGITNVHMTVSSPSTTPETYDYVFGNWRLREDPKNSTARANLATDRMKTGTATDTTR